MRGRAVGFDLGNRVAQVRQWLEEPAKDVATTGSPRMNMLRGAVARVTTPLLPDDYLHLVNPLWSARELRGRIVEVRPETADSATLVIKPGWGFHFDYRPGQYIGIGLLVDGRWHWRSYSLTSSPVVGARLITITVKAMPEGFLSSHIVGGVEPGTVVRLAAPQGNFALPEPLPDRMLFLTAGSGITPIMSMLRTMDRRGRVPDIVHIHSAPTEDAAMFRGEIAALADEHDGLRLHLQLTRSMGQFDMARLDELCPDWRDRQVWACGPAGMLAAAEEQWRAAGLEANLHLERFAVDRTGQDGDGGTVTFARSGKELQIDGATTLLEAGEQAGVQMPFGCRMGICQTCVVPLEAGAVRDLRNGKVHEEGSRIQTCISTAAGDCTLEL
ncbi:ferredoxin reductase [Tomitella fengzijianii]|uniref:Ferredoxin reductase n=1 Tax=Tomitella fengzijianii TaxID=2597660 RepID=A0A516X162_9ACTN|nr:ferredoxin reductase [Tomitella fengzijianii]QDQ96808.1 ferredoxin reductase [Tomitella fengzijianii]